MMVLPIEADQGKALLFDIGARVDGAVVQVSWVLSSIPLYPCIILFNPDTYSCTLILTAVKPREPCSI
ncbi:MAG: hypothetical protein QXJ03_03810 [Desulfurococcus sp.]